MCVLWERAVNSDVGSSSPRQTCTKFWWTLCVYISCKTSVRITSSLHYEVSSKTNAKVSKFNLVFNDCPD